ARRELRGDGVDAEHCVFRRRLDLRYLGQAYEIAVAEPRDASETTLVAECVTGFHRAHQQLYWWDDPARPVEIVTYRLHAVLPVARIAPRPEPLTGTDPGAAQRGTRAIYFAGHERPIDTPVFDRVALRAG